MELLIVDDEETALQAVLKNVKWEELPFKRVYTATNITSAEAELENEKIRIVLCDIEMPMGSGLDLLEWMNQNRSDVLCIFMTCHAEFSYAQKAIQLGSVDYILKPLDFGNLTETLKKTAERVKERKEIRDHLEAGRKAAEQQLWLKLFSGDISPNREEICRYIAEYQLDIQVDKLFLPMMVFTKMQNDSFSAEDRRIQLFALKNACGEIFKENDTQTIMETMADGNLMVIFCVEKEISEEDLLKEVFCRCEGLKKTAEQYLQMTTVCMIGELREIEAVPEQLERIYSKIYYSLKYRRTDIPDNDESYYQVQADGDVFEPEKEQGNPFVAQVKTYVEENLSEEMTVENLAEQVHLNADYLNRIFKKETGSTLSSYVLVRKVAQAKFLLQKTDWSIGDVAAAVGYYNYSSFNRSFKKVTGESPQEWRKRR